MSTKKFKKGNDEGLSSSPCGFDLNQDFNDFKTVMNCNRKRRRIVNSYSPLLCDRLKKVTTPSNKNCSAPAVSKKLKNMESNTRTGSASAKGKTMTVTAKRVSYSSSSYYARLAATVTDILGPENKTPNSNPKPMAASTSSLRHQQRQKQNQFSEDTQESSTQVRKRERDYRKFTVPTSGGGSQISKVRQSPEKLTRTATQKATYVENISRAQRKLYKGHIGSCEHDTQRPDPQVPALSSRSEYLKREMEAARVSLEKMEKTCEFDDNMATIEELKALCGYPLLKNPLRALGLILKE